MKKLSSIALACILFFVPTLASAQAGDPFSAYLSDPPCGSGEIPYQGQCLARRALRPNLQYYERRRQRSRLHEPDEQRNALGMSIERSIPLGPTPTRAADVLGTISAGTRKVFHPSYNATQDRRRMIMNNANKRWADASARPGLTARTRHRLARKHNQTRQVRLSRGHSRGSGGNWTHNRTESSGKPRFIDPNTLR